MKVKSLEGLLLLIFVLLVSMIVIFPQSDKPAKTEALSIRNKTYPDLSAVIAIIDANIDSDSEPAYRFIATDPVTKRVRWIQPEHCYNPAIFNDVPENEPGRIEVKIAEGSERYPTCEVHISANNINYIGYGE